MMKRVGLSRFSPLEVSRKVQQCLRFEGVNTNGVADDVAEDRNEMSEDSILDTSCCNESGNKSNLLNTIKKKLRKTKRNKRCDGRTRSDSNVCQCHSENCELHTCCSKNYRTRKHKQGDKCSVWPIASSILRCQNHQKQNSNCDDVAELIPVFPDDSDSCTCFGITPQNNCGIQNRNAAPSCSKPTTCSLSNVACDVNPAASSLTLNVESEGDLTNINVNLENNSLQVAIYADTVCSIDSSIPNASILGPRVGNLTQELYKLSKYGWYWGPINRSEAESKLVDQPDGSFLVRDSSDDRYILSLSFRSYGKTLHTRIEHSNGLFSFYAQPEPEGHASIVELIQQSMCYSRSGVFCYSRSRSPGSLSFPVRLTKPISRFTQVRSLQYLCRFVIRQYTRYDHIQKLPLPTRIKGYLEEGHY